LTTLLLNRDNVPSRFDYFSDLISPSFPFILHILKMSLQVAAYKQALAAMAKDKQDCIEAKSHEKRLREITEDSARALRARVTFLLDQLYQCSKLSDNWQDQKRIFQSQIASLYAVNLDVRGRLENAQLTYVTNLEDSYQSRTSAFDQQRGGANDDSRDTLHLLRSGSRHNGGVAHASRDTDNSENAAVAAVNHSSRDDCDGDGDKEQERRLIERSMFDAILAFSAAGNHPQYSSSNLHDNAKNNTSPYASHNPASSNTERTTNNSRSKSARRFKNGKSTLGSYKYRMSSKGYHEIYFESEDGRKEITEGDELLEALQIPTFMRHCQVIYEPVSACLRITHQFYT
jgi:hypothetical protein